MLLVLQIFTTADWINSIAAVAALLTAIITFLTVYEIKKQREHSYHPDLNVANFEFYVYRYDKDKEDDAPDSTYLYYSKNQMSNEEAKSGYNELNVEINNIGFGAAKNIRCYWEFDFSIVYEFVQCEKEPFITDWIMDEGELLLACQKLNVQWSYIIPEENEGVYLNFLLPYQAENRKNIVTLPNYFMDLYWLYLVKDFIMETKESAENDYEFPPLCLHVDYMDIHKKRLKKVFYFYLKYSFISNPGFPQAELGKFKFDILEKQF